MYQFVAMVRKCVRVDHYQQESGVLGVWPGLAGGCMRMLLLARQRHSDSQIRPDHCPMSAHPGGRLEAALCCEASKMIEYQKQTQMPGCSERLRRVGAR